MLSFFFFFVLPFKDSALKAEVEHEKGRRRKRERKCDVQQGSIHFHSLLEPDQRT